MRSLFLRTTSFILFCFVPVCVVEGGRPIEFQPSPIPSSQLIDATHLRRQTRDELEVVIVHQARGAGLLTFLLNGRAIAKLGYADWVRLYLSPGRYRFGAIPSFNFGRGISVEAAAEVTAKTRQLYRIFQSAGFTSSGGKAVYEISRE
jgi:hypothetical protein